MLPLLAMHSEQVLRDQVAQATGRPQDGAPIVQLKGDASNRSYLRVGRWPDSHVVMVMPPGPPKSEEASNGGPPDELPFVLPPGGYLETEVQLELPVAVPVGRYPVRVELAVTGGAKHTQIPAAWRQTVEDVCVVTVPVSVVSDRRISEQRVNSATD